jgi:hypothetical protein
MTETDTAPTIALRVVVIGIIVFGVGELVALINHELWPYLPLWFETLGFLPFYAIWAIVALAYRAGWPQHAKTAWSLRVSELATRDHGA